MSRNASEVEQAVARALRDSLGRLGRSTEELNQAIGDLVAACGSTRPANSLPPMIRAQTAAASLAASLEVLARFVTAALQPELRSPAEQETLSASDETPIAVATLFPSQEQASTQVATPTSVLMSSDVQTHSEEPAVPQPITEQSMESQPVEGTAELRASDMVEEGAPIFTGAAESHMEVTGADSSASGPSSESLLPAQNLEHAPPQVLEEAYGSAHEHETEPITERSLASQPLETPDELRSADMVEEGAPLLAPPEFPGSTMPGASAEPGAPVADSASITIEELPAGVDVFDVARLGPEEQELHRRANRVAKVSMQDIKMLRPKEVKIGKDQKDLCGCLRDDIERAHKEYERRFHAILGHPVDYFYDWMVEILAEGDPSALGEYPYPSPVLRH